MWSTEEITKSILRGGQTYRHSRESQKSHCIYHDAGNARSYVPLPSTDNVTAEQEGEIQILGVDENATADVFEALSSETARRILTAVYGEPAPPSEVADRLDMSIQNVSYHLDNLADAGLLRVADTRYSEKGAEMNVYAPASEPTVVFVGADKRKRGFFDVVKRLISATGLLFIGSVLLYVYQGFGLGAGGVDGSLVRTALSIPDVEFMLGGMFVLLLTGLW